MNRQAVRGPTSNKTTIIDPSTVPALAGDVMDDLIDAFNYYDKDNSGMINGMQFKNILHNFGFHKLSKKEMDEELRRHDIDLNKRNEFDFDLTKTVVGFRMARGGGKDDEAKDCFKLFDRKDKGSITGNDIRSILGDYLEFPITEAEINELVSLADPQGTGQIGVKDFAKLYNS